MKTPSVFRLFVTLVAVAAMLTTPAFAASNLRPKSADQTTQRYRDVWGGQKWYIDAPLSASGSQTSSVSRVIKAAEKSSISKTIRAPESIVVQQEVVATSVDNHLYTARTICKVTSVTYTPRVAGNDGSAVTLTVMRTQSTEAPTSGDDLLQATLDLKAAADTPQNGTLTATVADLVLAVGDRISVDFAGTLTAAVGSLTVELETMTGLADSIVFTAATISKVTAVKFTPLVAGTDAGAVTLMLDNCTGTEAPGSGTDILQAGLDLKGTINTVQTGTLSATAAELILAVGDRLCVDVTGSMTNVAGAVTVEFETMSGLADQSIFTAATITKVTAIRYNPLVAGTDVGTVSIMFDRCQGTEAPGAGDDLLTAALNLKGTAETVQSGVLSATVANLVLAAGNRLAIDVTGSMTDVAGVATVEFEAQGGAIDTVVYTAQKICKVTAISYTPLVAGTDAGAVTVMVDRCQGTEAPGAGDDLMTAALNLKGTAATVQNGTLTATTANLQLAIGDRLALDITGSPTDAAGVITIEVEMMAQSGSMPK